MPRPGVLISLVPPSKRSRENKCTYDDGAQQVLHLVFADVQAVVSVGELQKGQGNLLLEERTLCEIWTAEPRGSSRSSWWAWGVRVSSLPFFRSGPDTHQSQLVTMTYQHPKKLTDGRDR